MLPLQACVSKLASKGGSESPFLFSRGINGQL